MLVRSGSASGITRWPSGRSNASVVVGRRRSVRAYSVHWSPALNDGVAAPLAKLKVRPLPPIAMLIPDSTPVPLPSRRLLQLKVALPAAPAVAMVMV